MEFNSREELFREVERLNKKYCKYTKNKLTVGKAYGGYSVDLIAKEYRRNGHTHYRGGLGTGCATITYGYRPAKETLFNLYREESQGYLKNKIKSYETFKGFN